MKEPEEFYSYGNTSGPLQNHLILNRAKDVVVSRLIDLNIKADFEQVSILSVSLVHGGTLMFRLDPLAGIYNLHVLSK